MKSAIIHSPSIICLVHRKLKVLCIKLTRVAWVFLSKKVAFPPNSFKPAPRAKLKWIWMVGCKVKKKRLLVFCRATTVHMTSRASSAGPALRQVRKSLSSLPWVSVNHYIFCHLIFAIHNWLFWRSECLIRGTWRSGWRKSRGAEAREARHFLRFLSTQKKVACLPESWPLEFSVFLQE